MVSLSYRQFADFTNTAKSQLAPTCRDQFILSSINPRVFKIMLGKCFIIAEVTTNIHLFKRAILKFKSKHKKKNDQKRHPVKQLTYF